MFSYQDKILLQSLFSKAVADQPTIDLIYSMYKKYINPNAAPPKTNCNCLESVGHYFTTLRDFYGISQNRFDNG